jgi:hypothetical protein
MLTFFIFGLGVGYGGVSLEAGGGCRIRHPSWFRAGNLTKFEKTLFQAQWVGCEESDVRPFKLSTLISEFGACFMGCHTRQVG